MAFLFGFSTAGLLVSTLAMATISWALHPHRTTIRNDYWPKDER